MKLSRSRNYVFSSLTSHWEGDPQRQIEELAHAAQLLGELGPQPNWWFRIGIEQARCGELSSAENVLRLVETQIDPENDAHQAGLLRLRGELALAGGDIGGGIELMDASLRKFTLPATTESLAFAYAQLGSSDESVAALRAFVEEPPVPVGWEPQIRWQEAHVQLASMYVERKQSELAIPLLDSILESWSGADPDFALANEARELRERL
jgi:tetratricopeptide (TPR) repeat protein